MSVKDRKTVIDIPTQLLRGLLPPHRRKMAL